VKTCPKCKAGNLLRHGAKGPSAEGKKESTRRRRSANRSRAPPSDTAKGYKVHPAPGETVGASLSGSGKTAWVSKKACITVAIKRGHKPGTTLRYIQKAGNKCYYYAGGSSSGRAGKQNWRLDRIIQTCPRGSNRAKNKNQRQIKFAHWDRNLLHLGKAPPSGTAKGYAVAPIMFTLHLNRNVFPAPGETVGASLSGSGKTAWVSLRACITVAIKRGHKPGTTLRYIQKAGNKCYYYADGSSSGRAGKQNWRLDSEPQASASNCWPLLFAKNSNKLNACSTCANYMSKISHKYVGDLASYHGHGGWNHKYTIDPVSGCGACPTGQYPTKVINEAVYCHDSAHGSGSSKSSMFCHPDSVGQLPNRLVGLLPTSGICKGGAVQRTCIHKTHAISRQLYDVPTPAFGPIPKVYKNFKYVKWSIECQIWKIVVCKLIKNKQTCASALRAFFIKATLVHVKEVFRSIAKLPPNMQQYDLEYGICSDLAQVFG